MLGDPLRAVHVHEILHCWCPLGEVLASGYVGSRPCLASHLYLVYQGVARAVNHAGSQGHESRMRSLLRPNTRHVEASYQTAD